jgi:hypothetical protein
MAVCWLSAIIDICLKISVYLTVIGLVCYGLISSVVTSAQQNRSL